MKRVVEFLVELFPLDAAGRRAIDETLADWKYEAANAATPLRRMLAGLLGVFGVGEALGRVALVDLGRPGTYRACGGVLALAMVLSPPLMLSPVIDLIAHPLSASLAATYTMSLLPMALAVSVPLALLTPPYVRQQGRSAVAVCLLMMLFAIGNLGWLTPHANQQFREVVVRRHNPPLPGFQQPRSLPKGLAELTVPELVTLVTRHAYEGPRAMRVLNVRAVLLVMIPACLMLGVQARRYTRARGWRYGSAAIAWGVMTAAWAAATMGSPLIALFSQRADAATFRGYNQWIMPAVGIIAAMVIAHLARRLESRWTTDVSTPSVGAM